MRSQNSVRWLLLSAIAPVLACTAADDTRKILAVVPLSGDFAAQGTSQQHAIQMGIEKLHQAGADRQIGKKLGIVLIDAGLGTAEVEKAVNAAVEKEDVVGIISATNQGHEGSVIPAMIHGLPHFEVASGADEDEFIHSHEEDHGELDQTWAFSTRPLCNDEAVMTADFIADRFPGARVLQIRGTETHDYWHTMPIWDHLTNARAGEVELIRDPSVTVTDELSPSANPEGAFIVSYDEASWQNQVQAIVDAHAPDVIFWHLRGDTNNLKMLQDMSRLDAGDGFDGHLITCGMARKPDLIDPTKNAGISDYLLNRFFFVMRGPHKSTALTEFSEEYAKLWSESQHTFAPSAFDAAVLIGLGLVKLEVAGGDIREQIFEVATPTGARFSHTTLPAAVKAIEAGDEINYDGPSGSLDMEENHRVVPGDYYIEDVLEEATSSSGFKYRELADPPRRTLRIGVDYTPPD